MDLLGCSMGLCVCHRGAGQVPLGGLAVYEIAVAYLEDKEGF